MGRTTIEWADWSFNPWFGCTRVSPACENCYAEAFAHRLGLNVWGPKSDRKMQSATYWQGPLRWNRKAEAAGIRQRVFCASMADVLEDRPELREPRLALWKLIAETPALDWLLLTKRPENFVRMAPPWWWTGRWPFNAWVGTTVEDQARAEQRMPDLVEIPAPVRFISAEPLLERIDLSPWKRRIDWVITGAESGPHARVVETDWIRDLRDQCVPIGVRFFYKQSLENGRVVSMPELDGRTWAEVPA
jgi:protein gp37